MAVLVVVLFLVCSLISIINAQPNMVSLLPQDPQSVCRGESISYNCISSGTGMVFFSPPIVNESNPLTVLSSDPVQTCHVTPNSAAVITLVDTTGSPSFMGTFTLYISPEQSEGQRTVSCRVFSADGINTTNESTFFVLGAPSPVTSLNFEELASSSEEMKQVPVDVSWDSPENAEEFMLQIIGKNTGYIRSLENNVTILDYSATLCAINCCEKTYRDQSYCNENDTKSDHHACRISYLSNNPQKADVKKVFSTSGQLILAAVICSLVFFFLGVLVGVLCHRWGRVFIKPCTGDVKHSNGKRCEHPSPTDRPADDAPVVYEEVTTDSHSRQKIELEENVAYGHI